MMAGTAIVEYPCPACGPVCVTLRYGGTAADIMADPSLLDALDAEAQVEHDVAEHLAALS